MKKLLNILLGISVLLGSYGPIEAGGGHTLGVIQTPITLPSYSTSFPATENPISEGGRWTNGGVTALDWNNVRTTTGSPNKAYAAVNSSGDDDCIAVLSGFPTNQSVEATVYLDPTYGPPGVTHELELLLRFKLTAHSARGYEADFWYAGGTMQLWRWDGPAGAFTSLSITGTGITSLATGDIVKAQMVGNTITVYKNGSAIATATDNTFTDGNPGMGFYANPGATPDKYCISHLTASGLP